jgi:hypothetical protein
MAENYIKRLQREKAEATSENERRVKVVEQWLVDTRTYLYGPKFYEDTTVQTADVLIGRELRHARLRLRLGDDTHQVANEAYRMMLRLGFNVLIAWTVKEWVHKAFWRERVAQERRREQWAAEEAVWNRCLY